MSYLGDQAILAGQEADALAPPGFNTSHSGQGSPGGTLSKAQFTGDLEGGAVKGVAAGVVGAIAKKALGKIFSGAKDIGGAAEDAGGAAEGAGIGADVAEVAPVILAG